MDRMITITSDLSDLSFDIIRLQNSWYPSDKLSAMFCVSKFSGEKDVNTDSLVIVLYKNK